MSILGPDEPAVLAAPTDAPRRSPWPFLRKVAVLACVLGAFAALGGGGWYLLHHDDPVLDPVAGCRSGQPLPRALDVRVLNSTGRARLASKTGETLLSRGFRVRAVGNIQQAIKQPAQVRHPVGDDTLARRVAVYVPGAVLVADRHLAGEVDLVLGQGFTRVRTAAEVAALARRTPSRRPATTSRTPSAAPTCR